MKALLIEIRTRPPKSMRYKTVGDYNDPTVLNGRLLLDIDVAETGNVDMDFLIGFHELIESWLCYKRGIKDKEISGFDIAHEESNDPGRLKDAPYRKEHMFAERLEKMMARQLGVDWDEYWKVQDKVWEKTK